MNDRLGFFYGWIIAVSAMLALLISNGMTLGGLTVFDEAILGDYGWSRGALKFRDTVTFVTAGVLGPLAGALADRYGVRPLMALGAVLLGAGFFLYPQVETLTHLYALHLVFGVSLACVGIVVSVLIVSRWFTAKRGTAIGLALVGTSLGNVLFPPANTFLLSNVPSWQTAFRWLAVVPLLLIPIVAFVVREWPKDMGLQPYGEAAQEGDARDQEDGSELGMAYGEALRTRNFWALALTATATFYSILAIAAHLFLHLRDQGFEAAVASAGVSTLFLLGLVGKFVIGVASDYFDTKRVFVANLSVMFGGTLLFVVMSPLTLWPAVVLVGLGWGGLYTLLQLLIVESFGLKAAGKILGTITVMDAIGGGLGPFVTGWVYDQTNSYEIAFIIIVALVFVALLSATTIDRPEELLQADLEPHTVAGS
jgi:MFS family permease